MNSGTEPSLTTTRKGRISEAAAESLLEACGARVVARNFRAKAGEIDLIVEETIASGAVELVFVEVRGRSSEHPWVSAEESIDAGKLWRIWKTADAFLQTYAGRAKSMRLDVLAWDGERWSHLKDAARPEAS